MQINGQMHDQKKLQSRYDRLEGQIKSFMPEAGEGEGEKKDIIFLPDQQRRYNVKSQNAMFEFEKIVRKPKPV